MRPGSPKAPPSRRAARGRAVLALWSAVVLAVLGLPAGPAHAQPACRRFPATGQTVCGAFLQYWDTHGGLARHGWPISPAFVEGSDLDGRPYLVQYFERTVLEAHPENAPPYDVLPRLLDLAAYRAGHARGPETIPDPQPRWVPETGHALSGPF